MDYDTIIREWTPPRIDKAASVELWDSTAAGFGRHEAVFDNDPFLTLLESNHLFGPDSRVLDVGCGTGRYALAFARRCREVVGIDLSPAMLDIAEEKASEARVRNATFKLGDWHALDTAAAGFERAFDLVIAHMTPAIQGAESFLALGRASRGACAMAKPIRRTDPVLAELAAAVGAPTRGGSADEDIARAFSLLYLRGLEPRIDYRKETWTSHRSLPEARTIYLNRLKTRYPIDSAAASRFESCLASLAKDGFVSETVDTTVATVFWRELP